MGLQEARDILSWYKCQLDSELSVFYDYEKQQLYEALEIAVDTLNREIESYGNHIDILEGLK